MYYCCHSHFSLRYGTLSPEALVDYAAARGVDTLILADINNSSGIFSFIRACEKKGIRPIVGVDFRRGTDHCFTALAVNKTGFYNICKLLTEMSLKDEPAPRKAPLMEGTIIAYSKLPREGLSENEYLLVNPAAPSPLRTDLHDIRPDQLICWQQITFLDKRGFQLHRLLRCIDLNIVGSKLSDTQRSDHRAMPPDPAQEKKWNNRYAAILANTRSVLEKCSFRLNLGNNNNRNSFTGSPAADRELLFKLCREGLRLRYSPTHRLAKERLEKELQVIDRLGFSTYFLITWDIVRYARTSGFYHVGRGSGANSIAAYCLYITDVDPLELDLYFERFINPHRTSPPDFDIDFSWDERDQVTDYVFKRYGEEHTALLATYNTFGLRSVIRELGKVFGLPAADIDLIAEQPEATEKHHDYGRHILHYARIMDGMPNYLSIHAGGVLISERSLYNHTGLKLMPKGFPITHFDMHDAEDMGFHKYDILSQRGLGHIKDAAEIIFENKKIRLDVRDVARIKEDKKVKEQLKSGHCIGCFYIESPAMRGLLKKLSCDNYVHLVAASSIIRPGVAQSGMMREYIKRFHQPDQVAYLHPVFEEHLSETFGVMVYQEDVMKVVHHFAGLDLDESDVLRRIMTGKKKSGDTFKRLEEKYFRNCRERGYSEALSKEVWRMVESFSGYSFCKAHSASFAVESFQSLYLKAYYPLEFMVAVINNFGGFYSTEFYVHEARMCGAQIEAPCVNNSNLMTTIKGDTIYLGFIHMKNLERRAALTLCQKRKEGGPYAGIEDFMARTGIDSEQLQLLVRIGAFRFTGRSKFELMWEKCRLRSLTFSEADQPVLFDCPSLEPLQLELPEESQLEQAYDEMELLGFPLCSPFELLEEQPTQCYCAADLPALNGKRINIYGYLVCVKPVRTIHRQRMAFVTWLDCNGHFFDSIHFPPQWQNHPLRGRACYRIKGKVTEDFGLFSIEAETVEKLAYRGDPRYG